MIILADDDQALRRPTAAYLRSLGWEVREFADGAAAVAAVAERPPQLLLFDVQMPGMDGLQALDAVSAAHPALPCILITGHPDHPGVAERVDDLRVRLLAKPFALEELGGLVTELAGKAAG